MDKKPLFIAGPCVIESAELLDTVAATLADINRRLGVEIIFKASFDKANRTSISSFRGPGLEKGLRMLADVRSKWGLRLLTDIHESWQAAPVGEVVDVIHRRIAELPPHERAVDVERGDDPKAVFLESAEGSQRAAERARAHEHGVVHIAIPERALHAVQKLGHGKADLCLAARAADGGEVLSNLHFVELEHFRHDGRGNVRHALGAEFFQALQIKRHPMHGLLRDDASLLSFFCHNKTSVAGCAQSPRVIIDPFIIIRRRRSVKGRGEHLSASAARSQSNQTPFRTAPDRKFAAQNRSGGVIFHQ